jgi:hypothetical protein
MNATRLHRVSQVGVREKRGKREVEKGGGNEQGGLLVRPFPRLAP